MAIVKNMRGFPRTTLLSALLGLVSAGGSLGNCAMTHFKDEPQPAYKMAASEARFCYNTLGEISCFAAPQANMGPIVALEPEKVVYTPVADSDMDTRPKSDVNTNAPVSLKTPTAAKPAAPKTTIKTPIPNPPSTSLNPPKKGFPAEPLSLAPDYPESTAMPPASTIDKKTK
jgi:hypothetical protein